MEAPATPSSSAASMALATTTGSMTLPDWAKAAVFEKEQPLGLKEVQQRTQDSNRGVQVAGYVLSTRCSKEPSQYGSFSVTFTLLLNGKLSVSEPYGRANDEGTGVTLYPVCVPKKGTNDKPPPPGSMPDHLKDATYDLHENSSVTFTCFLRDGYFPREGDEVMFTLLYAVRRDQEDMSIIGVVPKVLNLRKLVSHTRPGMGYSIMRLLDDGMKTPMPLFPDQVRAKQSEAYQNFLRRGVKGGRKAPENLYINGVTLTVDPERKSSDPMPTSNGGFAVVTLGNGDESVKFPPVPAKLNDKGEPKARAFDIELSERSLVMKPASEVSADGSATESIPVTMTNIYRLALWVPTICANLGTRDEDECIMWFSAHMRAIGMVFSIALKRDIEDPYAPKRMFATPGPLVQAGAVASVQDEFADYSITEDGMAITGATYDATVSSCMLNLYNALVHGVTVGVPIPFASPLVRDVVCRCGTVGEAKSSGAIGPDSNGVLITKGLCGLTDGDVVPRDALVFVGDDVVPRESNVMFFVSPVEGTVDPKAGAAARAAYTSAISKDSGDGEEAEASALAAYMDGPMKDAVKWDTQKVLVFAVRIADKDAGNMFGRSGNAGATAMETEAEAEAEASVTAGKRKRSRSRSASASGSGNGDSGDDNVSAADDDEKEPSPKRVRRSTRRN